MTDPLVEKILDAPSQVLLYSPEREDEAREVMARVALQLAQEMSVSDPSLESLVIVDRPKYSDLWSQLLPAHITTVAQIASGEEVLSRHQSIVSLAPEFARRYSLSVPLRRAPRFYLLASSWKSAMHFTKLESVITLEDAA